VTTTHDELPGRFADMEYRHRLRHYQLLALDAFEKARVDGRERAYLVLPPGAGKTAVGLEAARRLGRQTLVLGPNSAIQAQWVAQWADFGPPDRSRSPIGVAAGTDRDLANPLTVLTYQSLCTLDAPDDPLSGRDPSGTRAGREQAAERRRTRTMIARVGDRERLLGLLHPNGRALVERMAASANPWTIILDECHHLLELWGWLVKALVDEIAAGKSGQPFVIGLTATPPADLTAAQGALHRELFGQADFEIATPAVVKEGHLAPYQELVHLTTPLEAELAYIEGEATRFEALRTELLAPDFASTGFLAWLGRRVVERRSPEGAQVSWARFERDKPDLARAAMRLHTAGLLELPDGARVREEHRRPPDADDWIALIEDWAVRCLARSADQRDTEAWEAIRRALPSIGHTLTRTGVRAGTTTVDRVLARSGSKAAAALEILSAEADAIGDRLRAVVLCDYELAGAELPSKLDGVLDPQAGGARLLLELLAADGATGELDPILVTGRSIACSRATASRLVPWLREATPTLVWPDPLTTSAAGRVRQPEPVAAAAAANGNGRSALDKLLSNWPGEVPVGPEPAPAPRQVLAAELAGLRVPAEPSWDDIVEVAPLAAAWSPRRYVPLVTRFFEEGGSRCLVGTRSLLGEGWDAASVNVVVDLSAATTPVSVHQMRGRSLRLDPAWPDKVAHNWGVVCVADGHPKGGADYERFVRKHRHYFALTEAGAVESGVSHVDPSLSPWGPPPVAEFAELNRRMRARAAERDAARKRWRVGKRYANTEGEVVRIRWQRPLGLPGRQFASLAGRGGGRAVLAKQLAGQAGLPRRRRRPGWIVGLLVLSLATLAGLAVAGQVQALTSGILTLVSGLAALSAVAWWRAMVLRTAKPSSALEDLASAVADGLRVAGGASSGAEAVELVVEPDGAARCQLTGVSLEASRRFAEAVDELLAPLGACRYIVPRVIVPTPANTGAAFRLVVRRAIGLGVPAGVVWHAVPSWLATNKERVEGFTAAWNRHVGPGTALFTGAPEGAGVLAAARGDDPFEVTTQLRTVWR
jgi:superfamily II DNA or RNA helicase